MIKKISIFGITDVGRARTHNEDDFAICKDLVKKEWGFKRDEVLPLSEKGALLVVADGMGGTNAGEVASHIAQETVKEDFNQLDTFPETTSGREDLLAKSIIRAHQAVINHQHENLNTAGMGSTLVVAWIIEDSVHVAWSGDSRCYIYNGHSPLFPFTDDHSLVWQMVEENKMTSEEARVHPESNIVIQSLGDEKNPPQPSVKSAKLYSGNRLILCSDGLNGMLSDAQMQAILEKGKPLHETCDMLVGAANEAGGEDNITCLMLEVSEGAGASERDLKSQYEIKSKPSTTRVLKTKNHYKNVIIGVLVLAVSALVFWAFQQNEPVDPVMPDEVSADTVQNRTEAEVDEGNDSAASVSGPEEESVDEVPLPSDQSNENAAVEDQEAGSTPVNPTFPINETPIERPSTAEKDSLRNELKPSESDSLLSSPGKKPVVPKDTLSNSELEVRPDSTKKPINLKGSDSVNTALIDSIN